MPRYHEFIDGTGAGAVVSANESLTNWYVEKRGETTALFPTPGFVAVTNPAVSQTGGRALWGGINRMFAIIGTHLYEYGISGDALTDRGTVATDIHPAQIVYNGLVGGQLFIASGANGYCYDLGTNTLTLELTGDCHQCGFLDGYFLALNNGNGVLRISALDDGTTWDPTQTAQRSSQPDPWAAMVVNSPDIWLLGSQTGDVWVDKGLFPFPLAPRTGLTIPYGVAANFSLAAFGGSVFWLTRSKSGSSTVVMSSGYEPRVIDSPLISTILDTIKNTSDIGDGEAFVYTQAGHTFYVLRFVAFNKTVVYDLTTGLWAYRGKWNSGTGSYDMWTPRCHMDAYNTHFVGDATGVLWSMKLTVGTEADGVAIRRERTGPITVQDGKRNSVDRFELLMEHGLGPSYGDVAAPTVTFQQSDNGGRTFSTARNANTGVSTDYLKLVTWTRLGSPRFFVPRVVCTHTVPWRILDAYINNE